MSKISLELQQIHIALMYRYLVVHKAIVIYYIGRCSLRHSPGGETACLDWGLNSVSSF